MIENYKLQSAEGLSLYLLYLWLAGDIGNLVSCILNHQLRFQIYLSFYFVLSDIILIYQYFQFRKNNNSKTNDFDTQINDEEQCTFITFEDPLELLKPFDDNSQKTTLMINYGTINETSTKGTVTFMGLLLFGSQLGLSKTTLYASVTSNSNIISSTANETFNLFGCILAWLCTAFYVLSRIPQICKNYKRRSTKGVSILSFSLAVCGNLTYAASILIYPDHTKDRIIESLPYLIGSLGIFFFDAIIFGQFLYYNFLRDVNKLII
ncbi:PQ loop repeat-domain-containing protein [Cokeromyces recurvatus]|uniref:PQ loop repeat-domain-containing protein n=1 Tax=Cokeromyces recurvatus TaxID=90255 RepID=UPI002220669A|nr:PQ loop repeat-domain-containing protein [Cokeromyces recurvatus]KAI7897984.1 PQ loop repeat-domain-containing protein [Cokeromyces recurvatus]